MTNVLNKHLVHGSSVAAAVALLFCVGGIQQSYGKPFSGREIELFVGSVSKPAIEAAATVFGTRTGARVLLHFGGSGQMLSQMTVARRGDIYLPGSSDFMELAKRGNTVLADTERILVYLIPAINVPKGNPKNIRTLADLGKPGVRVGIARPDAVCVGLYAVETLEHAGLAATVRPRIVTQTESCEKTAYLVALGLVDAVIGWRVFHYWQPDKIETVMLPPEQIARIGYIPVALSRFVRDREVALAFIEFLVSADGREIFNKCHYLTTEDEARRFARPDAPVGGEWALPANWK